MFFLFSADVVASLSESHQKLLISVITEGNQACDLESLENYKFSESVNTIYEGLQDQNSQIFKNAVHGDQSCFKNESNLCKKLIKKDFLNSDKQHFCSLLRQEPYKSFFARKNVKWVLKNTENILTYNYPPVNYPKLTPIEFFVYSSGLLPLPYLCPKTFSMHRSGEHLYSRQYGMALLQAMLNESECADVGIFYQRKHVSDGSTVDQYVKSSFCRIILSRILSRILKKTNRKRFYISCEENNYRFKAILYDLEKKEAYWFEPVRVKDQESGYIATMGFKVFYCSTLKSELESCYSSDVCEDFSRSIWDKTSFIKSLAFAKALVLLMQNKTFLDRFDSVGDRDKASFVRMAVHGYVPEYFEPLSDNMDLETINQFKSFGLRVKQQNEKLLADLNVRWEIFTRCFLKIVEGSDTFEIDQDAIKEQKKAGDANLQKILKIDFTNKSKMEVLTKCIASIKPFKVIQYASFTLLGIALLYLMLQDKLLSMPQ